jgi:hypothetical protein
MRPLKVPRSQVGSRAVAFEGEVFSVVDAVVDHGGGDDFVAEHCSQRPDGVLR